MVENEKKEEKKCGYLLWVRKPCGRALYDKEHCIFHSKDIEGKRKEFEEAFWQEFDRQREEGIGYIFNGFVFPDRISFEGKEFDKDVYFHNARFSGLASFRETRFLEAANFFATQFSGTADFRFARFYGKANFFSAQFSKAANFREARFSGEATFLLAQFSRAANFLEVRFSGKVVLNWARFSGGSLTGLFKALRNHGIKRILKGRYKIKDFKFRMSEAIAREYPVIDRMSKDDWYLDDYKNQHPVIYRIWWLFADCGRSFLRWAAWSIGISLLFGGLWWTLGADFFSFNPDKSITWISYFYYSFVTFTTLGFGDIVPTNWIAEILVTIEVILGYVMLGGLISIFANKLARRS